MTKMAPKRALPKAFEMVPWKASMKAYKEKVPLKAKKMDLRTDT